MVARQGVGHVRAARSGNRQRRRLRQAAASDAHEWGDDSEAVHQRSDIRHRGRTELGQPVGDFTAGRPGLYRDTGQHPKDVARRCDRSGTRPRGSAQKPGRVELQILRTATLRGTIRLRNRDAPGFSLRHTQFAPKPAVHHRRPLLARARHRSQQRLVHHRRSGGATPDRPDPGEIRAIPVKYARQLVSFTSPGPQSGMVWGENCFSYPMFRDFRDRTNVFAGVAARFPTALNLSYNNRSERIQAELVSGTWFDTLGLTTWLGRGLTPGDDRLPGAHPVVVLTYDYWKSRFNGNAAILNQTVLLNGHPMTVVGVAARGYRGFDPGARVDALVPTMMKAEMTPTWNGLDDRRVLWLELVGRHHGGHEGVH